MKQWGASADKMIFPYEHYSSIEQLKQSLDFPPWSAFKSTLTNSIVDIDVYNEARAEYYRRFALSDSDPKKYNNMADYLKVSV